MGVTERNIRNILTCLQEENYIFIGYDHNNRAEYFFPEEKWSPFLSKLDEKSQKVEEDLNKRAAELHVVTENNTGDTPRGNFFPGGESPKKGSGHDFEGGGAAPNNKNAFINNTEAAPVTITCPPFGRSSNLHGFASDASSNLATRKLCRNSEKTAEAAPLIEKPKIETSGREERLKAIGLALQKEKGFAETTEEPKESLLKKFSGPRRLSESAMKIILYWNSKRNLKNYLLNTDADGNYSKTVYSAASIISKLMEDKAFISTPLNNMSKAFTIDEIKLAIDRLDLIAHSKEYFPIKKEPLRAMTINTFVYNPFVKKSYFLSCVMNKIRTVTEVYLNESTNPYYDALQKAYSELVDDTPLTAMEKDKFVWGAKLLKQKIDEIEDNIVYFLSHIEPMSPILWAKWTIESLESYWSNNDGFFIKPGNIGSNFTYDTCLPIYLYKKGRLANTSKHKKESDDLYDNITEFGYGKLSEPPDQPTHYSASPTYTMEEEYYD
jgi:hypothetical protein